MSLVKDDTKHLMFQKLPASDIVIAVYILDTTYKKKKQKQIDPPVSIFSLALELLIPE